MNPQILIRLARDSIESHFENRSPDANTYIASEPLLAQQGAAFVTLTKHRQLRGCIGSLIAHRRLADDIIHNARSAAFGDPRFPPLNRSELGEISVEVSILTPPEPVRYRDAQELERIIRPGTDGVILRLGNLQATFLPQVWDDLRDFHAFFSHLGLKAGIGSDPLSHHPDIFVYQVDKYEEEDQ